IATPFFGPDGALAGVVAGILDLRSIANLLEQYRTLPGATITIVDHKNRVIYSTPGSGYSSLQDVASLPLVSAGISTEGVYRYAGSATDYHAGDRADAARSSGRDRSDSTLVA